MPAPRPIGAAGAQWMTECGYPIEADRLIVTAGGQHAMTAALGAITEPGDIVLTESLTYRACAGSPTFCACACMAWAMDESGIDPEAFETACRTLNPKAFYCVTNLQNPTALVVPVERRREIAAICQRYGVKIVEDDVYGFLLGEDTPPALSTFAPELGHYFTSLSKSMAPGLRVGYLALPIGQPRRLHPGRALHHLDGDAADRRDRQRLDPQRHRPRAGRRPS